MKLQPFAKPSAMMIHPHLGEESVFSDISGKNSLLESSHHTLISDISLISETISIECPSGKESIFKAIEDLKFSINALTSRLDVQSANIQKIVSSEELCKRIEARFNQFANSQKTNITSDSSKSCQIY
ncbi:hypothetical protein SteCoe_14036 [Stentor coeruleus]|uniref:Uncharacterized protein n=1 Tax=Stentor coeruleus TaxID=5963 RepID=A0A1R2C723_9CILI|nr:hypothetical protein SteCoe_14036 [Stentor coeruleus]